MQNLLSSEKRTLDHWATVQLFFSLAPVRCFWRCLFQKGLVSSFPEDVWAWRLLMHWLQLQFTPCEALPSVWIGLAWQYSQACGHPCCLCTFSYLIFSFNFVSNMLWYSTPWTAAPFSNDPLWLTLFVEGVNYRLLDHCQVSSVPHYYCFKEQEIPRFILYGCSFIETQIEILIFDFH